ncbi:protein of unknown function [uncultured Sphingopyxis sp.]|uniref:Uncharacterized protein n=1 Tax=uncultured Sphingopyxis sp. TaxID=310581 RepID=A0A1Y5PSW1_9SPHN|nr:protein of unknown function [uncultured Sphingopyxis sp.]
MLLVAISLRVLLVLLVGVVSHFPSPLPRHAIMPRHRINPWPVQMFLPVAGAWQGRDGSLLSCNSRALDRFIR